MTDRIIDTAEKVAEKVFEREAVDIHGRLDAHAARLRENQVEAIDRAGLPADLVAVETNVWKRLSPTRNRWPEIAEFDQRVAELEMRQAAKADELRELRDLEIAAPAADADRLATWQLDGEQGPRPEPDLPTIREQIQQRQEEREALTRATERVLQEKAEFVAKHRARLVKDADGHADEAHGRYLELVAELAEARAELAAARRATIFARLYPGEQAGQEPPDTLCGGRAQPLRAMGLGGNVAPGRVLDALKADADWLREAATPEQKALIGEGRDPRKPPATGWHDDPAAQAERDKRMGEWLTSR
jgi:hypothetical protein